MINTKIDLQYYWNKGISYSEYKEIISQQADEGKNSSDKKIKKLAEYTHLNISIIHKNDKIIKLEDSIIEKLKNISRKINLLIISEGWCGDASQSVPVINKLAKNSKNIELRIVFRDQNEELINQYLTNGGKSIPIVIIVDSENFKEIAHWGPRPQNCASFLKKYKETPDTYTHDDFALDIQNFYNSDKGKAISEELIYLF